MPASINVSTNLVPFENKALIDRLLENEERYVLAQASANIGIWDWNLETGETWFNSEYYNILNWPLNQPQSYEQFLSCIIEEDRAAVESNMQEAVQNKDYYKIECRIYQHNQNVAPYKWVRSIGRVQKRDQQGQALRITGVVYEISKRKKFEEDLLASERLHHVALDAAELGTWDYDIHHKTVTLDERAKLFFGLTRTGLIFSSSDIKNCIIEKDRIAVLSVYEQSQKADSNGRFCIECRVKHPNGNILWLNLKGQAFFEGYDRKLVRVLGIIQDITQRKRTEENLLQSEERYRHLVEGSIQGIFVHRNWKPLYVNQAFANIFEYDNLEELVSLPDFSSLVADEDRQRLRSYIVDRKNGHDAPQRYEHKAIKKNGTQFWVEVTVSQIHWQGEQASLVTLIDITGRKNVEMALSQTEERYRLATQAVNGIVYDWDLSSNKVHRSEGLEVVVGFKPQDVPEGASWWAERVHPDDMALVTAEFEKVLHSEPQLFKTTYRVRHKEGHWVHVVDRSYLKYNELKQPVRVVGSTIDISQEIKGQEALQQSEERYRALTEAIASLVWMTSPEGKLIQSNLWFERTGQTLDEMQGWGWLNMIHPDDQEKTALAWASSVASASPYKVEYRLHMRDGKYRWHEIRGIPILNKDHSIREWIGIAVDIHDRRVAEEKLVQANRHRQLALNAASLGTWDYDENIQTALLDEKFCALFGLPYQKNAMTPLENIIEVIHENDRERVRDSVAKAINDELDGRYDETYQVVLPDRSLRWVHSIGQALFLKKGNHKKLVSFSGVVADVTERHRSEEARQLLIRELNHRLKNLFAITNALISMTMRSSTSVMHMGEVLRGRLNALSRAHDLLQPAITGDIAQEGIQTNLKDVLQEVVAPYEDKTLHALRFELQGPMVAVGPSACSTLALIFHEFATNAAKYGALSQHNGHIDIAWSVEKNFLHLLWKEEGGPYIENPPHRTGFGSRLARQSILGQLKGEIDYAWNQKGLEIFIKVSINSLEI